MLHLGFGEVAIPADWVVNASINLVAPADHDLPDELKQRGQPLHPNVNVTVAEHDSTGDNTEALRDGQVARLEGQLPRFKLIDRGELIREDGVRLPFVAYTFAAQPKLMVKQVQTIERHGRLVYYVTATAPAAVFERHWDALKRVICTFRPASV